MALNGRANLFYVGEHEPSPDYLPYDNTFGVLLVGANCLAWCLIVLATYRGAGQVKRILQGDKLRWSHDARLLVEMEAPVPPRKNHLFISHVWRYGQDLAGNIKRCERLPRSVEAFARRVGARHPV